MRTLLIAGLLVAVAAVGTALVNAVSPAPSLLGYSSQPAPQSSLAPASPTASGSSAAHASTPSARSIESVRSEHRGPLGKADGILPDRVTVFDKQYPGIAKLDTDLLRALRRATSDAADHGVEIFVVSGWRSAAYQSRLLQEAVAEYGSIEAAARWVATPTTSPHVSGDAVDIGPSEATTWLSKHGSRYGLCQIYGNEPWHYELRPKAITDGCPRMYADPTHDPRMQP
jgi:D-alanyl-D-alanine carboxypeptidase